MGELVSALQQSLALQVIFSGLLGAVVGSFLNVVIHRLPAMLEHQWKQDCQSLLSDTPPADAAPAMSLAFPGSACPHCGAPIAARDNIPILSFALLGGRCRHCKTAISWQYPVIELITALLTAYATLRFGWSPQTIAAWLLIWALVALTVIDFRTLLLPDVITLPLLWAGLLASLWRLHVPPDAAILGATAGYLSLWSVFHLFRLLTGKEGMGYGDFKLFAALGAWFGWAALPLVILLAAAAGTVVGVALLARHHGESRPLPFGPYLAVAGLIHLFWGPPLQSAWLRWLGA